MKKQKICTEFFSHYLLKRESCNFRYHAKKLGFTLAEVLITIGIIGVVASLTIPPLVQNHKKQITETRLAKFYSTINQAIELAEIQYGQKEDWASSSSADFWEKYLKPNMKYLKTENNSLGYIVYLADGSLFILNGSEFIFYPEAKNYRDSDSDNTLGSKSFRFAFYPNNKVTACLYHRNKGVEPYMCNWNGNKNELYTNADFGCSKINNIAGGSYCAAVIQRNGWKIPKDYPQKIR